MKAYFEAKKLVSPYCFLQKSNFFTFNYISTVVGYLKQKINFF